MTTNHCYSLDVRELLEASWGFFSQGKTGGLFRVAGERKDHRFYNPTAKNSTPVMGHPSYNLFEMTQSDHHKTSTPGKSRWPHSS